MNRLRAPASVVFAALASYIDKPVSCSPDVTEEIELTDIRKVPSYDALVALAHTNQLRVVEDDQTILILRNGERSWGWRPEHAPGRRSEGFVRFPGGRWIWAELHGIVFSHDRRVRHRAIISGQIYEEGEELGPVHERDRTMLLPVRVREIRKDSVELACGEERLVLE
jgi:hypothetical protein